MKYFMVVSSDCVVYMHDMWQKKGGDFQRVAFEAPRIARTAVCVR